jgi:putative ABC transport system ATP-binding protein
LITNTIIQAKNVNRTLSLGHEPLHVLKNVSFSIEQGEWVALTGPSGSGKSTLLGLLAGIDTPTSGQLMLNNIDMTTASEKELARIRNQQIGIVFQSFHLIETLTAQENVEVPLYIHPNTHNVQEQARKLLHQVGLGERLDHRPHQLSGGQQQRVAIARALVTQPVVLLADEPTGNLDTQTGQQILKLFSDLRQQLGLTIVVVTHDPDVASYADRTLHLVDGELTSANTTIKAGA